MPAGRKDYYAVIGVPRAARPEEIRAAYRRLALRHHPDRNPGDKAAEARFREIGEAYATLADEEKRRRYDMGGVDAAARGFGGFPVSVESFLGPLEDMFGSFLAGIFGSAAPRRGNDLRVDVTLGLREAVAGAVRELELACRETCAACLGCGTPPGASGRLCLHCAGSGVMETGAGFLTISHTCHHCGGAGRSAGPACAICLGAGLVRATRRVSILIPAGAREGTRLRFAGHGDPARDGGRRGDLYCDVRVKTE
jgi:molecular chaperone DnaJ